MSYDDDDRERRRQTALSNASHTALVNSLLVLCWQPIRFILANLPAVAPAWIACYYLSTPLFSLVESTAAKGFALVSCFALLTCLFWYLMNACFAWAEKAGEGLGSIVKGAILVYVFAGYSVVFGFMTKSLVKENPWLYIVVAIGAGCSGVGYYLNKVRKDPTVALGQEAMQKNLDAINATYAKTVKEINRNY